MKSSSDTHLYYPIINRLTFDPYSGVSKVNQIFKTTDSRQNYGMSGSAKVPLQLLGLTKASSSLRNALSSRDARLCSGVMSQASQVYGSKKRTLKNPQTLTIEPLNSIPKPTMKNKSSKNQEISIVRPKLLARAQTSNEDGKLIICPKNTWST